jgi:cytochrome c oxidase assembly factor CtaG
VIAPLAMTASVAFGHEDAETALAWSWDPWTLVPLIFTTLLYTLGIWRFARERGARRIECSRVAAFAGGIGVLLLALHSPIDTLSEDLFCVHMVQHLLLMLAAPPLLVWSDPALIFLRAFSRGQRKWIGRSWTRIGLGRGFRILMHPLLIWLAFCGGFVFWHSPGPYQWALKNNAVHITEHLTFFVTSLAFWAIVIPAHGPRRLGYAPTMLLVVATALLSGLPGALMILTTRPLYPAHAAGAAEWGLTLLQDQQLAGLIMWIPAGGAYVLAAGWLFISWLREAELRAVAAARSSAATVAALACAGVLLGACDNARSEEPIPNFDGNSDRGASLVQKYGCGGCHLIPNVAHADGNVGPPLLHAGTRIYIAGVLRNTPENMAMWLRDPQSVVPGNAMPEMGISRQESQDITAFLYTLK